MSSSKKVKRKLANTEPSGESIGVRMRRLRIAFAKRLNEAAAEEVAFHLAELHPEMVELLALIARVETIGRLSSKDLSRIEYFFCDHWPYHVGLLRKKLEKIRDANDAE
jgi:hypothetical protein